MLLLILTFISLKTVFDLHALVDMLITHACFKGFVLKRRLFILSIIYPNVFVFTKGITGGQLDVF